MNIVICDKNPEVAKYMEKAFADTEVDVECDDILACKSSCVVAPGNSFGIMDGGIDAVYRDYFGEGLEAELQGNIRYSRMRELPVGQSIIVATGDSHINLLIYAPTMRVFQALRGSVNPYLATKSALITALESKRPIRDLAFPGMGTGVGNMPYNVCAAQMRAAYDEVIGDGYEFSSTWDDVLIKHELLLRGRSS